MYESVARLYAEDAAQPNSTKQVITVHTPTSKSKATKRVAAYCRVSTDSDDQLNSLENQMEAFHYQVAMHEDWELVDVYVDEGITGTSVKHRKGFQKMIADCEAGKVDYIITKSISRFARNTMDCLNYVRELQAMGVQLYFEKEGIDTAESISEMLLTVMAAFAQEESRSISENVKWGMRKRFEAGQEWKIPLYGYRHTEDEKFIIVPEEAAVVREVFTRYVHGETPREIVKHMEERGVTPPSGDKWKLLQIDRMLHNEKYTGDAVMQKNFIENHLTHKEVKNRGELPLYHLRNVHDPIIDRKLFAQAASIMKMREIKTGNSTYPYGTMLKCPYCGETLLHGGMYPVYFGGKHIQNGGWGCYGENGCRKFLLIQNVLDEAMLEAYDEKHRVEGKNGRVKVTKRPSRVDYYWLDDLIDEIRLGDNVVTVFWKDGKTDTRQFAFPHSDYRPENAVVKYNAHLDRVRAGLTKTKGKFTMGL